MRAPGPHHRGALGETPACMCSPEGALQLPRAAAPSGAALSSATGRQSLSQPPRERNIIDDLLGLALTVGSGLRVMGSQVTTLSLNPVQPVALGLGWLRVSSLATALLATQPQEAQRTLHSLTCHLPGLLAGFPGESGPCSRSSTRSVDEVALSLTVCPEPGTRV